jgi:hypothetical protein
VFCMVCTALCSFDDNVILVTYTGWRRETVKFEIIRKNRRKLTKLYLILKMRSTRVEMLLGITF